MTFPQAIRVPAEAERRGFAARSRLSWALTFGLLLVVAVLAWHEGARFEPAHLSLNMVVVGVFAPVAAAYTYWRYDARIAGLCDVVAVMAAFTLVAAIATYLGTMAGAARPLADAALVRVDAALGFDWRRYLAWADGHPAIGVVLVWCYGSVLKQVAALLICLTVLGHMRRLQVFVLAAQLALIVCAAVPAFLPALGAYPFLHIVPALDHPHLVLSTVLGPAQEVARLRGEAPSIALDTIAGVVVFPSFHTVLVVLFAWAFWSVPVLRWPALALNAGMLAATPLCGGHYLADVIAGFALALAALKGASLLAEWVSGDDRRKRAAGLRVSQPA